MAKAKAEAAKAKAQAAAAEAEVALAKAEADMALAEADAADASASSMVAAGTAAVESVVPLEGATVVATTTELDSSVAEVDVMSSEATDTPATEAPVDLAAHFDDFLQARSSSVVAAPAAATPGLHDEA